MLFPQLRRTLSRIKGLLEYNEFVVLRCYEYAEMDAVLFFELEVWSLPGVKKMVGPPVSSQKHSKEFLSKYKEAFVEENRWFAEKKREFAGVAELLNSFLSQELNALKESGVPDNIAKELSKAEILEHEEFWSLVGKDEALSAFLRKKYFESLV